MSLNPGKFQLRLAWKRVALQVWRRIMGTTVLDPGEANGPGLYVHAHSLRGRPGGVAMAVLRTDSQREQRLQLPCNATRYTLTAANLPDKEISLNGTLPRLGDGDALPPLEGRGEPAGAMVFPPAGITFQAASDAANQACG